MLSGEMQEIFEDYSYLTSYILDILKAETVLTEGERTDFIAALVSVGALISENR